MYKDSKSSSLYFTLDNRFQTIGRQIVVYKMMSF